MIAPVILSPALAPLPGALARAPDISSAHAVAHQERVQHEGAGPATVLPAFTMPAQLACLLMADTLTLRRERRLCGLRQVIRFQVLSANDTLLYRVTVRLNSPRFKTFFDVDVMDRSNIIVMRCEKKFNTLTVSSPPEHVIGCVVGKSFCLRPKFDVRDASQETILGIAGPALCCSLLNEVDFPVTSRDGCFRVGGIVNLWNGCCCTGRFADYDKFEVRFPRDMHVAVKALLIAAALLIDVSFFE